MGPKKKNRKVKKKNNAEAEAEAYVDDPIVPSSSQGQGEMETTSDLYHPLQFTVTDVFNVTVLDTKDASNDVKNVTVQRDRAIDNPFTTFKYGKEFGQEKCTVKMMKSNASLPDLSELNFKQILPTYASIQSHETAYLVQPAYHCNLKEWYESTVPEDSLNGPFFLKIMRGMLNALNELHLSHTAHGDISIEKFVLRITDKNDVIVLLRDPKVGVVAAGSYFHNPYAYDLHLLSLTYRMLLNQDGLHLLVLEETSHRFIIGSMNLAKNAGLLSGQRKMDLNFLSMALGLASNEQRYVKSTLSALNTSPMFLGTYERLHYMVTSYLNDDIKHSAVGAFLDNHFGAVDWISEIGMLSNLEEKSEFLRCLNFGVNNSRRKVQREVQRFEKNCLANGFTKRDVWLFKRKILADFSVDLGQPWTVGDSFNGNLKAINETSCVYAPHVQLALHESSFYYRDASSFFKFRRNFSSHMKKLGLVTVERRVEILDQLWPGFSGTLHMVCWGHGFEYMEISIGKEDPEVMLMKGI